MTSEGLQHPGHEPEEAAPGAAAQAPHGGHATASDRRYPPIEQGAPAADQQGWATRSPSQPTTSTGWEVDNGMPQGRAAVPAWNTREEVPADVPWAAQQPPNVPWAAQQSPGAGAWGRASEPGIVPPQGEVSAEREAAPEPPRLRWATTDIPQPPREPTAPPAPASEIWGAAQAWGMADQPGDDPAVGEQSAADGSAPAGMAAGADLPVRQRGRYTENLYQSDGSESIAFGAMSHDSGELPREARDQAWPDQVQPAGAGYGSANTGYGQTDFATDQGRESDPDRYELDPERYEQAQDRYQPQGAAPSETQWPDPPAYQPAPAPGITPDGAVPLPPQEARVPGATLAASPPADFEQSGGWSVPQPRRAEPEPGYPADGGSYPAENGGYPADSSSYSADGGQDSYPAPDRDDPPQYGDAGRYAAARAVAAAPPVIPQPRSGDDFDQAEASGAAGWAGSQPEPAQPGVAAAAVSASASVPLASRVMPPTDRAIRPSTLPSPQPRVYGRPTPLQPDAEEAAGYESAQVEQAQVESAQYEPAQSEQRRPADVPAQRGPATYGTPVTYGRTTQPDDAQEYGQPDRSATPDGVPAPPVSPDTRAFSGPAASPFGDLVGANRDDTRQPAGPPPFRPDRDDTRQPAGPPPFGPRPADRPPVGSQFGALAGERRPVTGPDQTAIGSALSPAGPTGPGRPAGQPWSPNAESAPERFSNVTPEPKQETKDEAPTPQVRNVWVLAAVLAVAVLLLVIPLGAVWLFSASDKAPAFNPAVGECVKQAGANAEKATCGDPGSFKVTAKAPSPDQCSDPKQPHIVVSVDGKEQVLCLQPAAAG